MSQRVGVVAGGSLQDGFSVHVDAARVRDVAAGTFVCICQAGCRFFSLITDIHLEMAHGSIVGDPPGPDEQLLQRTVQRKYARTVIQVRPLVMLDHNGVCRTVKTIPSYFAPVFQASEEDVATIFGTEHPDNAFFALGAPLGMDTPVCLDLNAVTERSNGIFGKTGTGKTFITRLMLAGVMHRRAAVNLIFDMHSEYALQARAERSKHFVKGLKTLFPDRVALFSLDPASTKRRGVAPDVSVAIPYNDVSVQDITSLQSELQLHPTACEAAHLLAARYKKNWLATLFAHKAELKELAETIGAHPESLSALYRKVRALDRYPFFVPQSDAQDNVINRMMDYIDRGISVVFEFGTYTSSLCYLLLANIITRRVHDLYVQKTERFLGTHNAADEPQRLLITIEEAHKFLGPSTARQTIFGTIAREMRKYYVSLLVVDQRPSGIDNEVLSQIGTKIVAQLHDERDINAVLTGAAAGQELRSVVATLSSKKQVLVVGHATVMPIVIQTREYDETFYAAMSASDTTKAIDLGIEAVFPENSV